MAVVIAIAAVPFVPGDAMVEARAAAALLARHDGALV